MSIKEIDNQYVASTYARFPICITRGKGSLAYDEDGNEYRFATNCNYQTVEAVEKFTQKTTLRIVMLESTKLVLSIQHNPADFKDKRESQEVGEITKKLFGVFCFPFNYKKHD